MKLAFPSVQELCASIDENIGTFRDRIADIPYEAKGVLYSEMFLLYLVTQKIGVSRILESGRARGQSTLVLARCFPGTDIISVEYDANSPDVAIAGDRLKHEQKVQQLFGDATVILPESAQTGDIALVDGPKGFRGVRLALKLLATGKVRCVFLHDACNGSVERTFLATNLPETFYSDYSAFAQRASSLDSAATESIPTEQRNPAQNYGFCLACIPYNPARNYSMLLLKAVWDGLVYRLFKRHK